MERTKLNSVEKTDTRLLLSRKETANLLGISLPTLDSYTRKGIIKARVLGNIIRYEYYEVMNSLKPLRDERTAS
ncbi:hypothetical protein [Sphingobacterium sp. BN32]|uniref:hypothetical protein n=1 Tax=Sphingobacterium sp. BN32 TaxID=3058432 RepID=UPI00265CD7A0|nr:hypothetical protein [Sphingobacterium sp. BN32]WKK58577.1 hypothetical protein QYC40_18305 [Sphingobacterium sp. BN32]